MNDVAHDVSGACCYCFSGFGDYHEPTCPLYRSKPVKIVMHAERAGATHATLPEELLVVGLGSGNLEKLTVIEPLPPAR